MYDPYALKLDIHLAPISHRIGLPPIHLLHTGPIARPPAIVGSRSVESARRRAGSGDPVMLSFVRVGETLAAVGYGPAAQRGTPARSAR